MNWLIKQWFYIKYFSGFRKVSEKTNIYSFSSYDLNDGQWIQDNAGWYFTKVFKKKYGIFLYRAKLDGAFEETCWPAMWLVNSEGVYFEIDIELMKGNKYPYLVYTTWVNPNSSLSSESKVERVRFNNKYFIKRIQSEYNDFVIDWSDDCVKFYINGILSAIIKNTPTGEMYLSVGNITMSKVMVY